MSRIDWARLIRLGVAEIGLRPAEFWDLTPAELMLIAGLDGRGRMVMTRSGLDALMARFPDRTAPKGEA